MRYLTSLSGLDDIATVEKLQKQLADLNSRLNAAILEGLQLQGAFVVGTPEAAEGLRRSKEKNIQLQNDLQGQIAALNVALDKELPGAVAAMNTPAAQADAARTEVEKLQRQLYVYSLPGKYDFGAGSSRRNAFYKDAGVGENMTGLFAMNRPTMGLDIWSVVQSGVKAGVDQYKNDPNKGKLPELPKVNIQGVGLPAWLTEGAKAVGKPIEQIGGATYKAYLAAKAEDRRVAEAQAAAQGSSLPNFNPPVKQASVSPLMLLGIAAAGFLAYRQMRSRR